MGIPRLQEQLAGGCWHGVCACRFAMGAAGTRWSRPRWSNGKGGIGCNRLCAGGDSEVRNLTRLLNCFDNGPGDKAPQGLGGRPTGASAARLGDGSKPLWFFRLSSANVSPPPSCSSRPQEPSTP